jgi:hypothetical protein
VWGGECPGISKWPHRIIWLLSSARKELLVFSDVVINRIELRSQLLP